MRLPRTVDRLSADGVLNRLASCAEYATHLPRTVRAAMACVCRNTGAVLTGSELAESLGVSRGRLSSYWRRAIPTGPTLKTCLDWLLLVRALSLHDRTKRWVAVAEKLGVHEHTIRRAARRRLNSRLMDIQRSSLEDRFQREVVSPLGLQSPPHK